MATLTMYDAITVGNIPKTALYVAGYVGGNWPTYATLQKQFTKATILSIAISSSENAECLDVETGDATIADIMAWYRRQVARGVNRPVIYSSVSNMNTILSLLAANKVSRQSVRLWAAHYANGNHICGPGTCGQVRQDMDGTQWTSNANGISLDQSTLDANFFTVTPVKPTTPTKAATMNVPPTKKNGDSDSGQPIAYVTRLQAILNAVFHQNIKVDGNYGTATELAVKAVQIEYKLTVDGVTGPNTWKVLYLGAAN